MSRKRKTVKPVKRQALDKQLSPDGFFLSSEALSKLKTHKKVTHDLVTDFGTMPRKFITVQIYEQDYLADAVTGHIYSMDGKSVTKSRMEVSTGDQA
jgi:hypothetical protein